MKVLVLMTEHFAEPVSKVLASMLPSFEVSMLNPDQSSGVIEASLASADFLVWSGVEVTAAMLAGARNLRLAQKWGSGVDGIDVSQAARLNIPIANVPGGNAISVAEHFFALMLSLSKHVCSANSLTRLGLWPQGQLIRSGLTELDGKTLGLVGFGHIGREIAIRAKAFGMRVLYHKRVRLELEAEMKLGVTYCEMPELLHGSDVLGLALPLTQATRGMFTLSLMSEMKSSAFLINISRGAVIVESDLYYALTNMLIAGAGLDVFCDEPPLPTNPLLQLSNIVLTPHIAGRSNEAIRRLSESCADNIIRVSSGFRPLHELRVTASERESM